MHAKEKKTKNNRTKVFFYDTIMRAYILYVKRFLKLNKQPSVLLTNSN